MKVLVLLKINIAVFVCGRKEVLNIQGVSEIGGLILDTWSVDPNIEKTSYKRVLGRLVSLRPP